MSRDSGVGNLVEIRSDKPAPLPFVVRPDASAGAARIVSSTYHARPAGVADRLQRSDDGVSTSSSEISAVLKSEPTRAALSDEADGFEVEAGPLAFDPPAFGVGAADILAWGTADNDGRKSSKISEKSVCRKGADIVIDLRVRVVFGIEGASPCLDFAGSHCGEAGAMHAERPAARSGAEQVEHLNHGGIQN
ncbi:hypothetical protein [Sphingomonas sp. PAMC26645]|uniref:hypothetical protein n=1 Tax=Sphingomonas sp. PAMC26645 TaxID=2565555 RepID=UPI001FF8DE90|nr:hypothetical protein [Sphingomonas sp. PAMC26645]